MGRGSQFRDQVIDPALKAGDLATLEKTTVIWKTIAEADKLEQDTAQSAKKGRSESLRFWIPIVAPLVGAAALVVTLMFQIQQSKQVSLAAGAAAEDSAWRDLLTYANSTNKPQGAFAFTLISSFLDSPRYGKSAREISLLMLSHSADLDAFNNLFRQVMERTDWGNLSEIAQVGARLNRAYQSIPEPINTSDTQHANPLAPPGPAELKNILDEELQTVARGIVVFMRQNGESRPADLALNFSGMQFGTIDLSGLAFSGSDLRDTMFFHCNVKDAVFDPITDHDQSDWQGTAWWRMQRIDPQLLAYLEQSFPYKVGQTYEKDSTTTSGDYVSAVKDLQMRSKSQ
jgi:hypothetical protein